MLQVVLFVLCSSHGGSQNGESLFVSWLARAANPYFGPKGLDIGGLLAAGVPYPCFPAVEADVGLCMQVVC